MIDQDKEGNIIWLKNVNVVISLSTNHKKEKYFADQILQKSF